MKRSRSCASTTETPPEATWSRGTSVGSFFDLLTRLLLKPSLSSVVCSRNIIELGFCFDGSAARIRRVAFLLRWSPNRERQAPTYGPRNGPPIQRAKRLRLHLPAHGGGDVFVRYSDIEGGRVQVASRR